MVQIVVISLFFLSFPTFYYQSKSALCFLEDEVQKKCANFITEIEINIQKFRRIL